MFDDKGQCSRDLAAHCKSLAQPAQQQEQGCADADLRIGRQQTDAERRQRHQRQRDDEHALSAESVAEHAQDEAAEWPDDVARGKRCQAFADCVARATFLPEKRPG
jgi:hypothetical protein